MMSRARFGFLFAQLKCAAISVTRYHGGKTCRRHIDKLQLKSSYRLGVHSNHCARQLVRVKGTTFTEMLHKRYSVMGPKKREWLSLVNSQATWKIDKAARLSAQPEGY